MKGESFTFITRSGEDIWKTMGIVEVMQKTGIVSSTIMVYPNWIIQFRATCKH